MNVLKSFFGKKRRKTNNYIFLEYIPGMSLLQLLDSGAEWNEEDF